MIKKLILTLSIWGGITVLLKGQATSANSIADIQTSQAELGVFPYLKTLPNFFVRNSSDSVTIEQNLVYVYDGKQYLKMEGKVSKQELSIKSTSQKGYSTYGLISEYTKVITTLGGKKIFEGKLPVSPLKSFAGTDDFVALASAGQIVKGAYQGIVIYVIKTIDKEIWIELQPYSIGSNYFNLLIIEKENKLIGGNINKQNNILKDLEKSGSAITQMSFELDKPTLTSAAKDELLQIVGVFQAHKDWKILIECHSAPLGDAKYTLGLTQKRAELIKKELVDLGVDAAHVEAKGWGDEKPIEPNLTEGARLKNSRIEIKKL